MKFGGSSIADGERMLNVLEIVKKQKGKKIVVLSACQNITDKLEKTASLAKNKSRKNAQKIIDEIATHHINIVQRTIKDKKFQHAATQAVNLHIKDLNNLIDGIALLNELTPAMLDTVLSFGEFLSTTVFHILCLANNLNNEFVDARELIKTDSNFNNASPLPNIYEKTTKNIIKNSSKDLIITQGFIAFDENSKTTTLGRGGSDLTAALLGAAINASEIQIWTDVDGILSADPKKNKNAKTVSQMTFQEVKDLSFWGAKVLHPKTILPAIEKKITVKVLNSFNPKSQGTTITTNGEIKKLVLNSVVAKNNCYLFNMKSDSATVDSTNIYDYASITNLLSHDEIHKEITVLYFGYGNGVFSILFEKNKENFFVKNSFIKNVKSSQILFSAPVSVICISGQNFKSNPIEFTKFISSIANHFEAVHLQQLIFKYSDSSVIFVIDSEYETDKIVEKIHDLIVKL